MSYEYTKEKMTDYHIAIYDCNDVISIEEDDFGNKEVHFLGFAYYNGETNSGEDKYIIEEYCGFYLSIEQIAEYIKKYNEKWYGNAVDKFYGSLGKIYSGDANAEDVKKYYSDDDGYVLPEIPCEKINKDTPVGMYIINC